MKSIAMWAGCAIGVLALSGCSFIRLHAPEQIGVCEHEEVVYSLAWGLVYTDPKVDCNGQPLAEVVIEDNFFFDLIGVVTLGIVSPKKLTWKCAPPAPDVGSLDSDTLNNAQEIGDSLPTPEGE